MLEELTQDQIDFLIDSSEFSLESPKSRTVDLVVDKNNRGASTYTYSFLKYSTFKEAQNIGKELNRLWIMKPFVERCDFIITWIEINISVTIKVILKFK